MSIAEKDPGVLALRLYREEQKQKALTVLNVALCRESLNHDLWLIKAIIRHSNQDWQAALSCIETAMTLAPLPITGQIILADCYAHLGKTELALMAYQHLLTHQPLPTHFYAGIYTGFRRCGRNDLALATCRTAVQADPEDHAAYFGMARCMVALGYSATFIASVLQKAVHLMPNNSTYRISLALQLARSTRLEEAYEQLEFVPLEELTAIQCLCSARKLLELCMWKNDEQRCEVLLTAIDRLS